MKIIIGCLVFLLLLTNRGSAQESSSAVLPSHLVDLWYGWPTPISNAKLTMTIVKDPGIGSTYYWSHYFIFKNSQGEDSGLRSGYVGLQTVGTGKTAIFSVWNAIDAGAGCRTFVEDGVGYQCLIPFAWKEGVPYLFSTRQTDANEDGDWWEATVTEAISGAEAKIGKIKLPSNSGAITTSVLFDEYFTEIPSCLKLPAAIVKMTNLVGNDALVVPSFSKPVRKYKPCDTNSVVSFSGNDVVIQTGGAVNSEIK